MPSALQSTLEHIRNSSRSAWPTLGALESWELSQQQCFSLLLRMSSKKTTCSYCENGLEKPKYSQEPGWKWKPAKYGWMQTWKETSGLTQCLLFCTFILFWNDPGATGKPHEFSGKLSHPSTELPAHGRAQQGEQSSHIIPC